MLYPVLVIRSVVCLLFYLPYYRATINHTTQPVTGHFNSGNHSASPISDRIIEGPERGILFPFPSPNFDYISFPHCTDPVVAVPALLKSESHSHFLLFSLLMNPSPSA